MEAEDYIVAFIQDQQQDKNNAKEEEILDPMEKMKK